MTKLIANKGHSTSTASLRMCEVHPLLAFGSAPEIVNERMSE